MQYFELFGLKDQSSGARLGPLERLDAKNVLSWVEGFNVKQTSSDLGSLQLLLTRHKRHQHNEIKPWYMAIEKSTFRRICSVWKLPSDYLFLRKNAAGCGGYKKHTIVDEKGSAIHLGFTIRVPHSPRMSEKAIWSMAVSWDATNGHIGAMFDGVSDADIQQVRQYLQAKPQLLLHPLLLPTMILELLNTFYIDHRREVERSLYFLELQLGITRGKRQSDVWDWDYELHRATTKNCNGVYTRLVYLERHLEFAVGLSQFLLDSLTSIKDEDFLAKQLNLNLKGPSNIIKETLLNNNNFAKRGLHQTSCLAKRCQALMTVLYTVIAQQDSKTNVKIAWEMKRDSSAMTAIAFLGFTFLPAMLVASMFSMSMFDFSANRSTTGNSFVNSNFWIFWAVALPLTLGILVVWKIWMWFQGKMSGKDNESLKQERTIAGQDMYEANLALSTPFYPGESSYTTKASLGLIF